MAKERFDRSKAHMNVGTIVERADVVQLAERVISKDGVRGSMPADGSADLALA